MPVNRGFQQFLSEQFAGLGTARVNEFDLALAVAQVVDEQVDLAQTRAHFQHTIEPLLREQPDADRVLAWFTEQGFSGPRSGRMQPDHSNLNWVLRNREGIPITLAVLLIETARNAGIPAHGINFPGHFLLQMDGRIADPLGLAWVGDTDLERAGSGDLQPVSPLMLGLRMLNNLKVPAAQYGDWSRVLDLLELQLQLGDGKVELIAPLHFERGEAWEALGVPDQARQAFETCASLDPQAALAQRASERAGRLPAGAVTLH